ncbi:methyltransferase family protein [Belliella baltica DSM 15883]|uniref:Methyltransferase family protein n=1 Tax=Belliella baltica (strain DSM 15883 / CIP 108006 / LMG 21964 / BA134) TaxID=866536 RepID=I3Z2L6_BELBD|nr:methyltransferase domain-containing protein [Belliella baltica]AFL83484.1 methyltransferase family protein [Belliella baltica DSM 15883]
MSKIKNLLSPSDNPESIGNKFRSRRFFVFETLIKKNFPLGSELKILDVGGAAYFWRDKDFLKKYKVEIILLNLESSETQHPQLKSIVGDATDLSEYKDEAFDLVFSNSVIEHLYTWDNQVKMANECVRVGKKHFIQSPNKHFIVEAHYTLPFAQYLPNKLLFDILTKTKLSQTRKWDPDAAMQYIEEIRLLTGTEMKMLFPKSTIYKEKFLGMTKSFVAHNL